MAYCRLAGILFTLALLGGAVLFFLVKNWNLDAKRYLLFSIFSVYTCIMFLPSMHERYGYLYEILAILVVFLQIRTLPCLVGMYLASFAIYGKYLFMFEINLPALSIVNTLAYIGYIVILTREMLKDGERAERIE